MKLKDFAKVSSEKKKKKRQKTHKLKKIFALLEIGRYTSEQASTIGTGKRLNIKLHFQIYK